MKKFILMGLMLFAFPFMVVDASSIYSIDMDVYVQKNGDAIITEVWDASVTDGTEGYHPYYNIGNSTIKDLKVSMDGESFTTVSNWNINDSFSGKAYKSGIYETGNEYDICFGISSYGRHQYTVKYTITGFVASLNDYDMIYWNLFPYDFSAQPNNVNISIYSDFNYSSDVMFYTYGKGGTINELVNNNININSNGIVSSDEYITVLIRFPKGLFNSSNVLDNDFDYYYDMAEEGAINYSDKKSFFDVVFDFVITVICIIIDFWWIFLFVGIAIYSNAKMPHYRFGGAGKVVRKDVPNFRDIPCNKDIYRAYWVSYQYGLVKKKEDFLGVVLLKWLRNGNVRVEKVEKDGMFKKKYESNIIFEQEPSDTISLEKDLYSWMVEASGDGKLESGEFNKWCKRNYSKIIKWFDDVIDFESKMLANEGKVIISKGKKFKIFHCTYYDVDDCMMKEAEEMAGLKKFLKEFTLIKEREPIEVHLWDEYLMYAQMFGIAEEVASQFKRLYPEVMDNMSQVGYNYDDIIFIHMICYDGMKSANAAQNSSSGSSGGGGGSFGGGGGGGGFR